MAQSRSERKKAASLQTGITHAQALAAITDRHEILLAEFNFPEGKMKTYQYTRYGAAAFKVPKYYLYFLNDTLVRKSSEEDLNEGARLALEEHRDYLREKARQEQRAAEAAARKAARDAERHEQEQREAEKREQKEQEAAARAAQKQHEAAQHKESSKAQKSKAEKPKKSKANDDFGDEDDW